MNQQEVTLRRSMGAAVTKAENIVATAKAESRDLTRGEQHAFDQANAEVQRLTVELQRATGQPWDNVGQGSAPPAPDPIDYTTPALANRNRPEIGGIRSLHLTDDLAYRIFEAACGAAPTQVTLDTSSVSRASSDVMRTVALPPMSNLSDYRVNQIADLRYDRLRLASLMPMLPTNAPSVTTFVETTGSTGADMVAAGGTKPDSNAVWTGTANNVRKIAHKSDVPKEYLDDFPTFNAALSRSLIAGMIAKENAEIANGDGTGQNLKGILQWSGIQTYAPGSAEQRVISVRKAITMLQTGSSYETEADVVVLNPSDWEKIQLSTASGSGEFTVTADPVAGTALGVWNTKVFVTNRLSSGTAIVANLADAATVYQREAPFIFVDPYSQSGNNLIRFICEERLTLAPTRPTAVVAVTFNGTS